MPYNGWKNKETWLVALWLGGMFISDQEDGIEVTQEYIKDIAGDLVDSAKLDGFLLDILNGSLYEIDYEEIAKAYSDGPSQIEAPSAKEA